MKSIGHKGLNNLLAAYEDKSAQAVATFGISKGPGQPVLLFQGRTDVRATFPPPSPSLGRQRPMKANVLNKYNRVR